MIDIDVDRVSGIIRHVAETEVMPRFNKLQKSEIREKNPGDFVTIADEESEKAFSSLLREVLPGSLVVGEEAVAKDLSVLDRLKDDSPVWIIDPVDGTYNFSHGSRNFGILIALVQGGVTQYGWAFDAPGGRMAVAAKGSGAFLGGDRLSISCGKTDMKQMVGQGGGAQAKFFDRVRAHFRDIVTLRCSLHDFMNFYTGAADFIVHVNKITPWDHAAANLIAEEAGAFVGCDRDGVPYDPTRYSKAFMLAAPDREWWGKLHEILYPALARKKL